MRRLTTVTVLTTALLMLTLLPAAAGPGAPEFQERYSFTQEAHLDAFLTDICGTEILHEVAVKGTIKFYEDGRIVDHYNATSTSWNPATGDTVNRKESATFRGMAEEIFNEEDQTLTVNFEDTVVGLPSMWYKPGEGVLSRDAGSVTFAGTAVVDVSNPNPEEWELISIDETITMNGPHSELEDFDGFVAIICGALGA